MKILVGCEFSGVVRRAFRARGHQAWSCDLLPADDDGEHLQCDVLTVLNNGWDVGIFFPTCTYLCSSGMHWTVRGLRDPQKTVEAIRFAEALWAAPIGKVCIENPIGVLSTRSKLGPPSQIIQPYNFGENASKATCLWLRGLPLLVPTEYIPPDLVTYPNGKRMRRWANQTNSGQNKLGPSEDRWKKRSVTYAGIAKAMAEQWG